MKKTNKLESLVKITCIAFTLALLSQTQATPQTDIERVIQILQTNKDGTKKQGKQYWEPTGDSIRHALMYDTNFINVNLNNQHFPEIDISYRVFDNSAKEIAVILMDASMLKLGLDFTFLSDEHPDQIDGKPEKKFHDKFGLDNAYETARRDYLYSSSMQYVREHSTKPNAKDVALYTSAIKLLR
jgi:hypothetical protein